LIEKLKKDRRRLDELVTLKESQLESMGAALKELTAKCNMLEARNQKLREDFEVRVESLEKQYALEMARLQQDSQKRQQQSVPTTACSTNQDEAVQ
jgi:peptidoglycan hydrolase CwlO-like protein